MGRPWRPDRARHLRLQDRHARASPMTTCCASCRACAARCPTASAARDLAHLARRHDRGYAPAASAAVHGDHPRRLLAGRRQARPWLAASRIPAACSGSACSRARAAARAGPSACVPLVPPPPEEPEPHPARSAQRPPAIRSHPGATTVPDHDATRRRNRRGRPWSPLPMLGDRRASRTAGDDHDGRPDRHRPAAPRRSSNCWMASPTGPDTARSRAPSWWMLSARTGPRRLTGWPPGWTRSTPVLRSLARSLAPCWPQHDLCLYVLDFVSELHSVLYLRRSRSARTLADQAEFHLRILPAAAELMSAETTRCDHSICGAWSHEVSPCAKENRPFSR